MNMYEQGMSIDTEVWGDPNTAVCKQVLQMHSTTTQHLMNIVHVGVDGQPIASQCQTDVNHPHEVPAATRLAHAWMDQTTPVPLLPQPPSAAIHYYRHYDSID